jgi:putative nucleotidyltransferase with HDIG domain
VRLSGLYWLSVAVMLAVITALVYYGGDGTASGLVHLYYVPIVFAAFFLGDVGSIVTAVAAAACLGPWMPQSRSPMVHQAVQDLAVRGCLFYAVGLLTARLRAQAVRRGRQASTLLEVTRLINASLDLDEVLATIAQKAVEMLRGRAAVIRLLADSELKMGASWGLSSEYREKGPVRVKESRIDQHALRGEIIAIRDVTADPRFHYREEASREGLVSMLCGPLLRGDRPVGVIRIYSGRRRNFTASDRQLLQAFAAQAAIAIENAELYQDIRENYFETVRALSHAIEAKDPATLGHSERVTDVAIRMAQHLGLSTQDQETIRFGGILHDIGKLGVAEEALAKESRREPEAQVLTRLHPLIGRSIIEPVKFLQPAADIVRFHHERWDGQGYPEGLAGESIPRLARLVAVANRFDELVSESGKGPTVTPAAAVGRIEEQAGTEFDPEMVEALAEVVAPARLSQVR